MQRLAMGGYCDLDRATAVAPEMYFVDPFANDGACGAGSNSLLLEPICTKHADVAVSGIFQIPTCLEPHWKRHRLAVYRQVRVLNRAKLLFKRFQPAKPRFHNPAGRDARQEYI